MIRDAVAEAALDACQMSAYEWDDRPARSDMAHDWRPDRVSPPVGPDLAPSIYRTDSAEMIAFLRNISIDDARAMLATPRQPTVALDGAP